MILEGPVAELLKDNKIQCVKQKHMCIEKPDGVSRYIFHLPQLSYALQFDRQLETVQDKI